VAQSTEKLDALFVNLVMIFKTAAFQQMGKTLNPITGKLDKNLEQARFSIDMIEMLKEKTEGNLSEELGKFIDSTLLELRMNYVEEAKAAAEEGAGGKSPGADDEKPGAAEAKGSPGAGEAGGGAEKPGSAKAKEPPGAGEAGGGAEKPGAAKAKEPPGAAKAKEPPGAAEADRASGKPGSQDDGKA
jgi:hypothetical protein